MCNVHVCEYKRLELCSLKCNVHVYEYKRLELCSLCAFTFNFSTRCACCVIQIYTRVVYFRYASIYAAF